MSLFGCCRSTLKTLSRAAAKSAAAKVRAAGGLRVSTDWARRTEFCERCALRVVRHGVSYCGKPLLEGIDRQPAQGCGCPVLAKARDPSEHCPISTGGTVA